MPDRRPLGFSTDRCILLTPDQALRVCGTYAQASLGFVGLELGAFRWAEWFLKRAVARGIPVAGLHGRVGPSDDGRSLGEKFRPFVANRLLLPTPRLVELGNKYNLGYILVHVQEARRNMMALAQFKGQVRIENDTSSKYGYGATIDAVKQLIKWGVKAIPNIDTYHWARETGVQDTSTKVVQAGTDLLWRIDQERDYLGRPIACWLHEAIGPLYYDSYYLHSVDDTVMKERALYFSQHPETGITTECQWPNNQFFLTPENERQAIGYYNRALAVMERHDWLTLKS